MKSNHLLILSSAGPKYPALLEQFQLPDLKISICQTTAEARQLIGDINMVLGNPYLLVPILAEAKKLRWVQSTFAGVEALCEPGLRRDYLLTGVKQIYGPLISEYVFGYILSLARRMPQMYQNQKAQRWEFVPYQSVRGKRLGVCGLGSIGRHVARTGAAFGLKVTGYKRTSGKVDEVEKVFSGEELGDFLSELDYLVMVLPNTTATDNLIDGAALAKMKSTACLINVGRGNSLDDKALLTAVRNSRIETAVLDVFREEPLPADHPFWLEPNIYVTPHIAAESFPEDLGAIFAENYLKYIAHEPLLGQVDFARGY